MQLNYAQKENGLFLLTRNNIEHVACAVLSEYAPHNLERPCSGITEKPPSHRLGGFNITFCVSRKYHNSQSEVYHICRGQIFH